MHGGESRVKTEAEAGLTWTQVKRLLGPQKQEKSGRTFPQSLQTSGLWT